jgi:sugar lactone lactonase YvrE
LGGADGTRLFVTTARYGLDAATADVSGSIFAAEVTTAGLPVQAYRADGSPRAG